MVMPEVSSEPVPELSRNIVWMDRLGDEAALVIDANTAERAALARRFGLEALDVLNAVVTVKPWRKGGIKLAGRFHAVLCQTCVVTLEPIETVLDEVFERCYLPPDKQGKRMREAVIDPEKDEPDVLDGTRIDAGEVVAEALGLEIEPYPRKEGVLFSGQEPGEIGKAVVAPPKISPFSILTKLKKPD